MEAKAPETAKFDPYAAEYASLHDKSVSLSGESSDYFVRYKIACLDRLLGAEARGLRVLDYGCGVGLLTRLLADRFERVEGYDLSIESLKKARADVPGASFHERVDDLDDDAFDVAVLSGVLHHVPRAERRQVLSSVRRKLRPDGGRVVVFEHNPLNPLTKRAVEMCPFDDDALLLGPREAQKLLAHSGFSSVRRDFIVFFPRMLAPLRFLEPSLRWLPIGAQMMLVGRRGERSL